MHNTTCSTTDSSRAALLLGPTGSGKTPLGELLEARGLWGMRCVHFDFGANLRQAVDGNRPGAVIGRKEIEFLKGVLASGALLEDEHFPLAARVLEAFLADRRSDCRTRIVLNGLPRHVGQAEAVDRILDVETVISLSCSRRTVMRRIAGNVGGDRSHREDDDPEEIDKKLATFNERTVPLQRHYARQGARIESVEVTAEMTPEQMWQELDGR